MNIFIDFRMCRQYLIQTQKYFPNIRFTETYHIPNEQKFYEDSDERIGFGIAPLHEG